MKAEQYFDQLHQMLGQLNSSEIESLVQSIYDAYHDGRFVFIIGNGGSGANASHLCEDLGKGTLSDFEKQKRLKVISLTDNTPYILAWGNDEGYDRVFVEQLKNLGSSGDLLIAISGSGNSPNVLRAVEWANETGLVTFGITGYDGGALKKLSQRNFHVPSMDMGLVEAVHSVVFHWLVDELKERFKE